MPPSLGGLRTEARLAPADFYYNSQSTTIHVCGHNDDNDRLRYDPAENRGDGLFDEGYDCAEPYTEKVSGCHDYYLIGGYHGEDQNEAAGRYNGKEDKAEPMIVCVK